MIGLSSPPAACKTGSQYWSVEPSAKKNCYNPHVAKNGTSCKNFETSMLATCTVRRVRRASATRRSGAACEKFLILTHDFIIDPRKELGPFPLSEKSLFVAQTEIAIFQSKMSRDDSSNYWKLRRICSPWNIFLTAMKNPTCREFAGSKLHLTSQRHRPSTCKIHNVKEFM